MSNFQIGVIAAFVVFAVVGVLFFSGVIRFTDSQEQIGEVVIWGTVPRQIMVELLGGIEVKRRDFGGVTYEEKNQATYETELVEALAAGSGPDLFLLPQDSILRQKDKLFVIPYENYPERTFRDLFIQEGELYLDADGVLGIPFLIDPMIMYVNRNILASAGIAAPPEFWDELFLAAPKIVVRDQAGNVTRSAVSFGEFSNVRHAKEILAMLLMQAGNSIVARQEGIAKSVLDAGSEESAEAALRFYTEFSNPIKTVYSWNRALPESRQQFLTGTLALYFGFGSELSLIRQSNPNLNFDISAVPQSRDGGVPVTFGRMQALSIPKQSDNISGALTVATVLTGREASLRVSEELGLPPVRRDLLAQTPTDAVFPVLYTSAIMSRGWLDPHQSETADVFRNMVETTVSGEQRLSEAIRTAHNQVTSLLNSI